MDSRCYCSHRVVNTGTNNVSISVVIISQYILLYKGNLRGYVKTSYIYRGNLWDINTVQRVTFCRVNIYYPLGLSTCELRIYLFSPSVPGS